MCAVRRAEAWQGPKVKGPDRISAIRPLYGQATGEVVQVPGHPSNVRISEIAVLGELSVTDPRVFRDNPVEHVDVAAHGPITGK